MTQKKTFFCRLIILFVCVNFLTGCVWWRLLQTKIQMEEFDKNFTVVIKDDFTLVFNEPLLFRDDFVYLAKLQPTSKKQIADSERWRYVFRKVDKNNEPVKPDINFYWDLTFNGHDRLEAWSLSSKFTKIALPVFFEIFLRSLADAEIDTLQFRVEVDMHSKKKISVKLPKKEKIIAFLGKPLVSYVKEKKNHQTNIYRFILDSPDIEEGYESRAITTLKLRYDIGTDELISMSGRYAGLKISINYQKLIDEINNKTL